MGQDQDRGPRVRGNGGIINLSSPGKSRAWERLLGTSAVPGAQPGWGIQAATRLARTRGNKARGWVLASPCPNSNQGFNQSAASSTAETGFPNLWASPAMGMGMTGLGLTQLATDNLGLGPPSPSGATAFGGPGQWARPTTGMGISGISFAQPAMGNQGGGQATTLGATATGCLVQGASPENQSDGKATASGATATVGPVQGASPTTGTGTNVAGVQGRHRDRWARGSCRVRLSHQQKWVHAEWVAMDQKDNPPWSGR